MEIAIEISSDDERVRTVMKKEVADPINAIFAKNLEVEDTIKEIFSKLEKPVGFLGAFRTQVLRASAKVIAEKYGAPWFIVCKEELEDRRRSRKAMEIFLAVKPLETPYYEFPFTTILYILPGAKTAPSIRRNGKIITAVRLPAGEKLHFIQRDCKNTAEDNFFELYFNPIGNFTL